MLWISRKFSRWWTLLSLVSVHVALGYPQELPTPTASVEGVWREHPVFVRVLLRNPTAQPMIVPYCGRRDAADVLCGPTAGLEVHAADGWHFAYRKSNYALVGYPMPEQAITLDPQSEKYFLYRIDERLMGVTPGERVRLVVFTWPDQRSIDAREPGTRLVSLPFNLPPICNEEERK
jgi:hypothetical protein